MMPMTLLVNCFETRRTLPPRIEMLDGAMSMIQRGPKSESNRLFIIILVLGTHNDEDYHGMNQRLSPDNFREVLWNLHSNFIPNGHAMSHRVAICRWELLDGDEVEEFVLKDGTLSANAGEDGNIMTISHFDESTHAPNFPGTRPSRCSLERLMERGLYAAGIYTYWSNIWQLQKGSDN